MSEMSALVYENRVGHHHAAMFHEIADATDIPIDTPIPRPRCDGKFCVPYVTSKFGPAITRRFILELRSHDNGISIEDRQVDAPSVPDRMVVEHPVRKTGLLYRSQQLFLKGPYHVPFGKESKVRIAAAQPPQSKLKQFGGFHAARFPGHAGGAALPWRCQSSSTGRGLHCLEHPLRPPLWLAKTLCTITVARAVRPPAAVAGALRIGNFVVEIFIRSV